jgi:SAM-dependent methyltransferase
MAIEAFTLRMLSEAKRRGAVFTHTLTLGRQHLSVRPADLDEARRLLGRAAPELHNRASVLPTFADDVLTDLLEITSFVSMDCSGYEGAALTHDFNVPVPESHWNVYDAVLDGGTLEHVFNFPVAIANCMKMLRVGGRFFALTPANNHCGHGFYQFSPELFFRVFSEANGFAVEHVLAIEHAFPGIELTAGRTVYTVRDPAEVGERVGLVSSRPVYLFVQAVKRADVEPFAPSWPQQSDYAAAWTGAARPPTSIGWRLHRALPFALRRPLLGLYQRWRRDNFRNTAHYRRWDQ